MQESKYKIVNNISSKKTIKNTEKWEYQEWQIEKKKLIKQHKKELEKLRIELLQEYKEEFRTIHDQLVYKLNKKQQKAISAKEKEIEERCKCDIKLIEKEHEAKLKLKIAEIYSENERKASRVLEENIWLKKQVESLKRQLTDYCAKNEVEKVSIRKEGLSYLINDEEDHEYDLLFKDYNQLQKDYLKLKKTKGDNLCSKCRAFTEKNEELSKKILTLRNFLDFDSS